MPTTMPFHHVTDKEAPLSQSTDNACGQRLNAPFMNPEIYRNTLSPSVTGDLGFQIIDRENRDATLAGALKIAASLPRQRKLADDTLALVKELLDWREDRRLPDPYAGEDRTSTA